MCKRINKKQTRQDNDSRTVLGIVIVIIYDKPAATMHSLLYVLPTSDVGGVSRGQQLYYWNRYVT